MAGLSVLVALAAVEGAVRVADRAGWMRAWREARAVRTASIWTASDVPGLVYVHRPGYVKDGIRVTERHGILRPDDVADAPAPGVLRVLLLGDSVAGALKLPYEARFGTILEGALARARAPGGAEVLNLGVNGYSTSQEAALLRMLGDRLAPGAIVLEYCMNDFHPSAMPTRWFRPEAQLRLVQLVRDFTDPLVGRYPPATFFEAQYQTDDAGWRSVVDGFHVIADNARARGIPAVLVIFPLLSRGGWMEGAAASRHARVAEVGRAAGFEVVDLLPVYAEERIGQMRLEPWDSFHPNAHGHRLAADVLFERLRALGLAEPPGATSQSAIAARHPDSPPPVGAKW